MNQNEKESLESVSEAPGYCDINPNYKVLIALKTDQLVKLIKEPVVLRPEGVFLNNEVFLIFPRDLLKYSFKTTSPFSFTQKTAEGDLILKFIETHPKITFAIITIPINGNNSVDLMDKATYMSHYSRDLDRILN
jgi:hypothetical protein